MAVFHISILPGGRRFVGYERFKQNSLFDTCYFPTLVEDDEALFWPELVSRLFGKNG